jgi:hypothetical protein
MILLRQKIFFEYGLTSSDIKDYATKNNMSVKAAKDALYEQRKSAGVAQSAYKDTDKSSFRASVLQGSKDADGKLAQGVLGKSGGGNFTVSKNKASASAQAVKAQQQSAANPNREWAAKARQTNLNKQQQAYNKGQVTGYKQGQQSVGILGGAKNTWNSMNNTQKGLAIGGTAAVLAGGAALAIRNRNKRKQAERELEEERARNRR